MLPVCSIVSQIGPGFIHSRAYVRGYFNSPTYHLELVGADDHGGFDIDGAEIVTHSPFYDISPIHLDDLPDLFKTVPQVEVTHVVIAPSDENADPRNTRSVQGKVFTVDGPVRYLKPRLLGRERAF